MRGLRRFVGLHPNKYRHTIALLLRCDPIDKHSLPKPLGPRRKQRGPFLTPLSVYDRQAMVNHSAGGRHGDCKHMDARE